MLTSVISTVARRAAAATPRLACARGFHSTVPAMYDADLRQVLQQELRDIEEAGTYKKERVITSAQDATVSVAAGGHVLNFCANNYLGLSNHPRIVAAGKKAIDSHGMGLSSVRFICGTQDIHKSLEAEMSAFHGFEDTILYPSCFDANAGLFEGVLTNQDAVISDELNHASIIDGIRLCKAQRYRYKHANLEDLEKQLQEAQSSRLRMVVTDGVFSMDGEVAPLPEIADLCDKYKAILMIDECHGTGVIGKTGKGTPEYYDMMDRVDIINSTFGKALGGATGGYTSGPKEVVDILRQRGRPYLFSNSLCPATVASAHESVRLLNDAPEPLVRLKDNTALFRSRMTEAGFVLGGVDHPISPVMLGDARLASEFADQMLTKGIYVIGFSYPVVPKGKARIRVQLSGAHTKDDVNRCVDAFIEIGKERSII